MDNSAILDYLATLIALSVHVEVVIAEMVFVHLVVNVVVLLVGVEELPHPAPLMEMEPILILVHAVMVIVVMEYVLIL
jgi:hypothetical protein